jgi:hypothetical protein
MPITPDLSVFRNIRTKQDFDRMSEEWALNKAMKQAELKKLTEPETLSVQKLGEQGFMKAAMGVELSPEEMAAATFLDAKSGGLMMDPETGGFMQKPRISDRIPIGGIQQRMQGAGLTQQQNMPMVPPIQPVVREPIDLEGIQQISMSDIDAVSQKMKPMVPPAPKTFSAENPVYYPNIGQQEAAVRSAIELDPFYSNTPKGREEARKLLVDAKAADIKFETAKNKPMPGSVLGMQNDLVDTLSGAGSTIDLTNKYINQIDSGELNIGPLSNIVSRGRNTLGWSTPQSANFSSFRADLEKMRNNSLRLNAGVQTDGDAQRAWNELFQNINDPLVVRQRLGEIQELNKKAIRIKQAQLDDIRSQYNKEPMNYSEIVNGTNGATKLSKAEKEDAIFGAKKAIRSGKSKDGVRKRLIENGIDPTEAGL